MNDHLKPIIAVLFALSQTGWLNSRQIHILCLPGISVRRVRATMKALEEQRYVVQFRWRSSDPADGDVWAITPAGVDILRCYHPFNAHVLPHEYRRPMGALAESEWKIQLLVRRLLVELVIEARQRPWLAAATVLLPSWPPHEALTMQSDAVLTITWKPAQRQEALWFPWTTNHVASTSVVRYVLLIGRSTSSAPWHRLDSVQAIDDQIALLLMPTSADCQAARASLTQYSSTISKRAILLGDVQSVAADIGGAVWQTVDGTHVRLEETSTYIRTKPSTMCVPCDEADV